jgi:hypothetical protein
MLCGLLPPFHQPIRLPRVFTSPPFHPAVETTDRIVRNNPSVHRRPNGSFQIMVSRLVGPLQLIFKRTIRSRTNDLENPLPPPAAGRDAAPART